MSTGVLRSIAADTTSIEQRIDYAVGGLIQLCQANPLRYSIGFSNPSAVTGLLTTEPAASPPSGIEIGSLHFLQLKVSEWGALVQKAWWLSTAVAPGDLTVFELVFSKDT